MSEQGLYDYCTNGQMEAFFQNTKACLDGEETRTRERFVKQASFNQKEIGASRGIIHSMMEHHNISKSVNAMFCIIWLACGIGLGIWMLGNSEPVSTNLITLSCLLIMCLFLSTMSGVMWYNARYSLRSAKFVDVALMQLEGDNAALAQYACIGPIEKMTQAYSPAYQQSVANKNREGIAELVTNDDTGKFSASVVDDAEEMVTLSVPVSWLRQAR